MKTRTLILIVSTVLVLVPVLRFIFQPRVRRTSPRKRYTIFAMLFGCGVSAQVVGAVIALATGQHGRASLLIVTALLLSAACILEMRKLSGEF